MALQPRNRRDTPAQERAFQSTRNKDVSALQQAGMHFQDRDRENDAVAQVVGAQTRQPIPRSGSRGDGSPTLRAAGDFLRKGPGTSRNAGPPPTTAERASQQRGADAITGAVSGAGEFLRRGPGTSRNAGPPVTTAEQLQQDRQGGAIGNAFRQIAGSFSGDAGVGSGFTQQQMRDSEAGFTPRLNLRSPGQYFREEGAPSPTIPDWVLGGPSTLMGGGNTGGTAQPGGRPQVGLSAIDAASQVDASRNQGFAIGPDGRTQFFPGTQRNTSGISVMNSGGGGNAAAEFQRAIDIRNEMIESQRPQNQVTVLPSTGGMGAPGGGGVGGQIERLIRSAGSTRDPWQRAAINRQISQLQAEADRGLDAREGTADRQSQMQLQQLRNQGMLDVTQASNQGGSVDPYDMARAQETMFNLQQAQNPLPSEMPGFDPDRIEAINAIPNDELRTQALQDYARNLDRQQAGFELNQLLQSQGATFDDTLEDFRSGEIPEGTPLYDMMVQYLGGEQPTENMAGGGLVPEFSALSFAQGGMVPDQYAAQMGPGMDVGTAMGMGAPGVRGVDLLQQEYTQYAQGAEQLGVPAIPFEEFVGLKQKAVPQAPAAPGAQQPMTGAMQSAIGMAAGGQVPGMDRSDASGKMIVDSNPQAPQDSIPAVIDGNRPAKLDSGEFVLPREVVMFFGTDKLNKMIEQAKQKGQGNGTQSGTATGSATGGGSAPR